MKQKRGATHVVQTLVKRGRARAILAIQTICLAAVGALAWGGLARMGYTLIAVTVISILAVVELVLVILFFRQKPESDEIGIQPVSDNAERLVLNLPDGATISLDRKRQVISAGDNSVQVPTAEIRFIQVENAEEIRILAATQRDLVMLYQLENPRASSRADVLRVARRLARSAAVPLEEG